MSKQAQIMWLFDTVMYPKYEKETDKLERCILAYRYYLSIFDYAGFTYVVRTDTPTIVDRIHARYGKEKGDSHIMYYCTWRVHLRNMRLKGKEYLDEHLEHDLLELFVHMEKKYGIEFIDEWKAFQKEYNEDGKINVFLRQEEKKIKNGTPSAYINETIFL